MAGHHRTQPKGCEMQICGAPHVSASSVGVDREALRELSLLLSFFKAVGGSPLLCGLCKQGLCSRYLASTLCPDMRALITQYIAGVSIEADLRGLVGRMLFGYEKLAERNAQPELRDEEQPDEVVSVDSWDCGDAGTGWGGAASLVPGAGSHGGPRYRPDQQSAGPIERLAFSGVDRRGRGVRPGRSAPRLEHRRLSPWSRTARPGVLCLVGAGGADLKRGG